jgi:hypothetical protein
MLVTGAMIILGAYFTHQALHRRAVTIPTGLLGIGVLGVGIFPGNIHPWHPIFAYTAFLAGGLAVLLSYQGESRILDSREDVCARQTRFEYPATSVPFSTR